MNPLLYSTLVQDYSLRTTYVGSKHYYLAYVREESTRTKYQVPSTY